MNDLKAKLENVNARIAAACKRSGRTPGEVKLLAVSKQQSAGRIRELHAAGQAAFGENYLTEALPKQAELVDLPLEWHYIGPLQSNKTGAIAGHFDWVQTVDREKTLRRLSQQRPAGLPALNICLQVNIDREPQKAGADEKEVLELATVACALPRLRLRGLMAIPRVPGPGQSGLASFHALQSLYHRLRQAGFGLDTLSMGMSADLEEAIAAGSTLVRVGTDLFGPRT